MAIESTFVMVKPDGVRRGLVGEVVSRFERKGLQLDQMRMLQIDDDLAARHYAEHVDKPFYGELAAFITSGPVVAMQWTGASAVSVARTLMGPTNPAEAPPGDHSRRFRTHHHRKHRARIGFTHERRPGAGALLRLIQDR